ncbi:MAG: malic enzyme-like NAD(P)-binding protein [Ignavibacteriales bacterium]
MAALINSLKLLNKKIDSTEVVITGAGSAGYGIFKILEKAGCKDIIVNDSKGAAEERISSILVKIRVETIIQSNKRYPEKVIQGN